MSKKQKNDTVPIYHGAGVLKDACMHEYFSQKETNSKLYDKINLALAFCGIVFFEFVRFADFGKITNMNKLLMATDVIKIIVYMAFVFTSFGLFMWALISLIGLAKGRRLAVFDTELCRNEQLYRAPPDRAELHLIYSYASVIAENRPIIEQKQKGFNSALTKLVVSIILFIVVHFMQMNIL